MTASDKPASPENAPKPARKKPEEGPVLSREEKLAEALRANFKRRKQAARKTKDD